jgi:hypothetical protein
MGVVVRRRLEMNKLNVEFAGLALLAAIASVAGTLAATGGPLHATTLGIEVGRATLAPPGADVLKVRYGLPERAPDQV